MIFYVIKQKLNHTVCFCCQEALSKYALGIWQFQISPVVLCIKMTVLVFYLHFDYVSSQMWWLLLMRIQVILSAWSLEFSFASHKTFIHNSSSSLQLQCKNLLTPVYYWIFTHFSPNNEHLCYSLLPTSICIPMSTNSEIQIKDKYQRLNVIWLEILV